MLQVYPQYRQNFLGIMEPYADILDGHSRQISIEKISLVQS